MKIIQYKPELEIVLWESEDKLTVDEWKRFSDELRLRIDWLYGGVRDRICLVCGQPFQDFDLHHAIVSRKDVMGWSKKRRKLINVELNLIPLHNRCHLQNPPSREVAWAFQSDFYGEDILELWYYSLPFKIFPRRF
jgi:hypothetical protein